MKLRFKKEFKGDLSVLPTREVEGAVAFKEPESMGKLSLIANGIALGLTILALIPLFFISGLRTLVDSFPNLLIAVVLSLLVIPVHEVLHALCFKGDVDFYTYLKKGCASSSERNP